MTARGDVIEEPAAVAAEVERLIARLGAKEASRQLYMGLDVTPLPAREQLAQALHGVVLVRITPERAPTYVSAQQKKETERTLWSSAACVGRVRER